VKTLESLGAVLVAEAATNGATKNLLNNAKTSGKEGGVACIVSSGCVHIGFGVDGDCGSARISSHFWYVNLSLVIMGDSY
jgi:hypothetical protein